MIGQSNNYTYLLMYLHVITYLLTCLFACLYVVCFVSSSDSITLFCCFYFFQFDVTTLAFVCTVSRVILLNL